MGGLPSVPYSWPSQALVVIRYRTDINFGGKNYSVTQTFRCSGTLINSKTVVTAGHCIVKTFYYQISGYVIPISVTPNQYYQTIGSMYTVYLGVYNIDFVENNTNPDPPGISVGVSDVILVRSKIRLTTYTVLSTFFLIQK